MTFEIRSERKAPGLYIVHAGTEHYNVMFSVDPSPPLCGVQVIADPKPGVVAPKLFGVCKFGDEGPYWWYSYPDMAPEDIALFADEIRVIKEEAVKFTVSVKE